MVELFSLTAQDKNVLQVQRQQDALSLCKSRNVVGMGVGRKVQGGARSDEACLTFLVSQKVPRGELDAAALLPEQVGGVRTDVLEVGHIFAGQA